MDQLIIILTLYSSLVFVDLIPTIKSGQKKPLLLKIPVYLITLAINVMAGFGFPFPYINEVITDAINFMLGIK